MKKISQFLALTGIMACAFIAQARDDKLILSIQDALNNPEAAKVLDPQIKVYYAQGSGKVIKRMKLHVNGRFCQQLSSYNSKQLQSMPQK